MQVKMSTQKEKKEEEGNLGVSVDIGVQTDLNDDPDVYYFAGGRHVGCQTNSLEEYPPLTPQIFDSTPRIVFAPSSDFEGSSSDSTTSYTETEDLKTVTVVVEHTRHCCLGSHGPCDANLKKIVPETLVIPVKSVVVDRPVTPVETKSTQVSAGALVSVECKEVSVVLCASVGTSPSGAGNDGNSEEEESSAGVPQKSTFAEKAKTGLLKNQAKSVSTYLNKLGVAAVMTGGLKSSSSGCLSLQSCSKGKNSVGVSPRQNSSAAVSGGRGRGNGLVGATRPSSGASNAKSSKIPSIPNYRSNIASRCRTAVNTGQAPQQVKRSSAPVTPTHSKMSPPSDSSSKDSPPAGESSPLSSKVGCGFLSKKSISPSPTSSASITVASLDKKSHWKPPSSSQLQSSTHQQCKVGILRSKSMINPVLAKSQSSLSRTQNTMLDKRRSTTKFPPQTAAVGSLSAHQVHSNSYISLPDETSYLKRHHMVDEDGWETVKTRSSRSKWSSSNSSLASSNANQSRNSLDKGSSSCMLQTTPEIIQVEPVDPKKNNPKKVKLNGMVNNISKKTLFTGVDGGEGQGDGDGRKLCRKVKEETKILKKELGDDESSMDEDEITKKEADLDDAIREEELLEKELLQVEKEFERIEKDESVGNGGGIDHTTSPEVPDDEIGLDDHYFFVSMDGREPVKNPPMKDPTKVPAFADVRNSPAKEVDKDETLRRYEAKLAKAERNREILLQIKFNQFVELSDRFKALNQTTIKLVSERDELISRSVNRRTVASEKRRLHLKNIQRKAHDEDSKAREIAFINLLEAQNKRHDYFVTAQEIEDRLQARREDRRLKLDMRGKKITLVIRRQERIKKDWQKKLESLQEKRRKTEARIQREKEERARERVEMAQEKARDREVRISALNAAKQAEKEELQKKIKQKQEDSARRHEENIEHIRQKAIELGSLRSTEETCGTSVRVCNLCKVLLQSEIHEMQHIRGRAHLDAVKKADKTSSISSTCSSLNESSLSEGFGLKYITDVSADKIDPSIIHQDKNRFKSMKKHVKKLFQKLMDAGKAFEKAEESRLSSRKQWGDPNLKSKIRKNILELERLVGTFNNNKGTSVGATQMDRLMVDIRKASVKNDFIQDNVMGWNALGVALKVIQCQASDLPLKSKINACDMIHGFVTKSLTNGLYIVRGSGICTIMNICAERWNSLIPDDNRWLCNSPSGGGEALPTDPLIESLMRLLFQLLEYVPNPFSGVLSISAQLKEGELEDIKRRTHDIIGYLVTSGVIDRITVYCGGVRGPVDDCPGVAGMLQIFLDFLTLLVYILQLCWGEDARGCIIEKKETDSTQLLAALESSELAGAVSMSYSLLLHQGAPSRSRLGHISSNRSGAAQNGKSSGNNATTPPPPGINTAEVIKSTLCLINAMARLDLIALQNVLGSETLSLQFRHIASQLLWLVVPYRNQYGMRRLLTELVIAIGNFTVGNKHNQSTIQSGQTPTVLQLLCDLPSEYFTEKLYQGNLFPTLLAATHGCPENREVLMQKNIDLQMLENYLNSDGGKENVILKRLERLGSTSSIPMPVINGSRKKCKGKKEAESRNGEEGAGDYHT